MWRQEVSLAGNAIGSGFEGENLRMKLLEKGLDVHLLQRAGTTPVCDVYVTADGDRTMFGYGFHHEANHTPFDSLPFQAGHWFTADPNIPNASRVAAKIAHTKKMNLYLMDFSRDNEIIPKGAICQYGTDSVGERGNREVNLNWVSNWTLKHQCTTILTDGGLGLYVAEPGSKPNYYPAFPPVAVVDSTGAGDAFRAGTIYGLIQKMSLKHSLRFGAAAAALKVANLGATENVPSLVEVESWIEAHPETAQAYDI
jgi:sugar/nucleoside kinase (ribokinase family)